MPYRMGKSWHTRFLRTGDMGMTLYRVFMLGNGDHFVGSEVIDCASDQEALLHAPAIAGDHPAVEVWELARHVGRVDLRQITEAE